MRTVFRCRNLRCVTLTLSSKLERIGAHAFTHTGVQSILIPDRVVELCDECFYLVLLQCAKFGALSRIECICTHTFTYARVESICILNLDSVHELGYSCFESCWHLRSVTLGPSSSMKQITAVVFRDTKIELVTIPDSVVELDNWCFGHCR